MLVSYFLHVQLERVGLYLLTGGAVTSDTTEVNGNCVLNISCVVWVSETGLPKLVDSFELNFSVPSLSLCKIEIMLPPHLRGTVKTNSSKFMKYSNITVKNAIEMRNFTILSSV